ncbi:hypothetical protein RJ640_029407 [Escallonia rubra]|uniref:Retrotransposon gag domain-containing protein n=1 Tax=Escallonia rubra TaxID=112253 RepID=A0AA88RTG3_9ASTE|nr:hypothetical protein RJ640_029407 [Escallonia rubra]
MDVAAAETWVNELDKIFEVMGCSDKQKDERHRARKFRDGLRFEIRRQMSILDNPTYAQVVDGAQRLERLHGEQLRIWEDKRKRRHHNESNSGGGRKPSSDANRRSIETWVNELDKIFEVMGCSDKQKAKQINGGMTSRMMTSEDKADLTRQAFQDRFFTKYFPPNVKEAMESDFTRIAQHPNETITEYEERFARLSRFALHIVQDERHRARKFWDGLRFEIRRQMSILDNPTYAQVVDGAQRLERLHGEQLRIWEDKRKRRHHNESNSGGGRKPSSDANRRSIEKATPRQQAQPDLDRHTAADFGDGPGNAGKCTGSTTPAKTHRPNTPTGHKNDLRRKKDHQPRPEEPYTA